MSDRIAEIRERAKQYAKRYPWRLEEGTKDFLPRDRAYLLARLSAVMDALDREGLARAIWEGTALGREVIGWDEIRRSADTVPRSTAAAEVTVTYERADAVRRHVLGEETKHG